MRTITCNSMLVLLATMLNLSACNGQDSVSNENASSSDPIDPPKVDVRVNKEYDDQGNLIRFDSTYSAIYEGRTPDKAFLDSVFKDFQPYFDLHHPWLEGRMSDDLFLRNGIIFEDFFHDDSFRRHLERDRTYFDDLIQRMDSSKNAIPRERANRQTRDL